MNRPKSIVFILFFNFWGLSGLCQQEKSMADSSFSFPSIGMNVNLSAPGEDLLPRFGYTWTFGLSLNWKTKKNYFFETGAKFLFGEAVKQKVAWNVVTHTQDTKGRFHGLATGADGRQSEVRFQERGFIVPFVAGKIFPVFKRLNPNSGLYLLTGGQFIQHRIWIEVPGNNVPALNKEMRKGYDRLAAGFGVVEGMGIRFFSNKRFVNFSFGLEMSQNFTMPMRNLNFDSGTSDTEIRKDFLWGIHFGWVFPIYRAAPDKEYFF